MRLRRTAVAAVIAAAAAGVAYGLTEVQALGAIFEQPELSTVDYRVRSTVTANRDSSGVVLVLFDSASVEEWPYLSPYPRAPLARLVEAAAANGARVIGLDVLLDRRQEPVRGEDGDALLRDAIATAGNVVLVAGMEGEEENRRLRPPDPYFAEAAAAVASADIPTPYETARDAQLITVQADGTLVPGFALALWALAEGRDLDSLLVATTASGRLDVPGMPERYRTLPDVGPLNAPVLFAGPPSIEARDDGAFWVYPAWGVEAISFMGRHPALSKWMDGKAVLLGSGFHDSERFRSPFYDAPRRGPLLEGTGVEGVPPAYGPDEGEIYGWTYGVEIHANALHNLLAGDYLIPLGLRWKLLLLFGVAGLVAGVTFVGGVKWGAGAALLAVAGLWWGGLLVFYQGRLVLPMIAPALSAGLSLMGAAGYVSVVEGRDKRMIRGAFSKFVPPGVVDELVADPSRLKLGGERRSITVIFSDLAGFTSMSERLSPERLVSVLNEYLDEMAEIIFQEKGTLDKYIGDAIMALFGAPASYPDHALRGCRTVLRMQRRLGQLNEEWQARDPDWPALAMRIGVNSGEPVVGNIGGQKRFDYTALGDAVNLAARLEPACKTYRVAIMIAEQTRVAAGDAIQVRELDRLAVYGKAEPVTVYELLALADEPAPLDGELLEQYGRGLAAYRDRDFEMAVQYFNAALEVAPGDGPAALYLERSRGYLVEPPPEDWDFVERRQVK